MEQLLSTKFYIPPTRRKLVSRPLLVQRINEGLHRKLTLISAPAGFGKTTLVSEWGEQSRSDNQDQFSIAWLSLDESDNDLIRFLTYFITAFRQVEGIDTNLGGGALSMLQTPQSPPAETILTALINDISALSGKIILVLDDYHLISQPTIDNALSFLLENLPPQLHLIIVTRVDPQLPLARLRAGDQLNELRATDLRFTSSEAAEFLNETMGLALSEENITALENRTEGWIAGLQLAAISMGGQKNNTSFIKSFTGSYHFVLDYLIEEVLDQQSENIKDFLLKTAILDRMNGPLCNTLTGQNNGQQVLDYLEHANLFIVPLDNERCWYRYHRLFVDLLKKRLNHSQPQQLLILHQKAGEWYQQNGMIDEAIEHALKAEDFEQAAHLIEEATEVVWIRSENTKLQHWLDGLPDKLLLSKPQLCIVHAWYLYLNGQLEEAERRLQAAEFEIETRAGRNDETSPLEDGQPEGSEIQKILGRVAAVRSVFISSKGDVQGAIQYARQALDFLPENELTWRSTALLSLGSAYSFIGDVQSAYQVQLEALEVRKATGNVYMIIYAGLNLAITLKDMGKLQQAQEICRQQIELANNSGLSHTTVTGWLYMLLGELKAERNELDKALQLVDKGAKLTQQGEDVVVLSWSCLCLMRVLFSRREFDKAEEIIQKMNHIALERDLPRLTSNQIKAWQVRIWLAEDKLGAASKWADEYALPYDKEPTYIGGIEYGVLARILIAQGRIDETISMLQRLAKKANKSGHVAWLIEIRILEALAYKAKGETDTALTALERALILAQLGGFLCIFVDEGPPMARLLYEALDRGISPEYVGRLLNAFPDQETDQPTLAKMQDPNAKLIEPLTDRECEVLGLIAEGLTNQEIATKLFLSMNTIKVHTRNIFGKLSVNNRTQAVAKAKALGILPPD